MFNLQKIAGDRQGIVRMWKFVILRLKNALFVLKYSCKKWGLTKFMRYTSLCNDFVVIIIIMSEYKPTMLIRSEK